MTLFGLMFGCFFQGKSIDRNGVHILLLLSSQVLPKCPGVCSHWMNGLRFLHGSSTSQQMYIAVNGNAEHCINLLQILQQISSASMMQEASGDGSEAGRSESQRLPGQASAGEAGRVPQRRDVSLGVPLLATRLQPSLPRTLTSKATDRR